MQDETWHRICISKRDTVSVLTQFTPHCRLPVPSVGRETVKLINTLPFNTAVLQLHVFKLLWMNNHHVKISALINVAFTDCWCNTRRSAAAACRKFRILRTFSHVLLSRMQIVLVHSSEQPCYQIMSTGGTGILAQAPLSPRDSAPTPSLGKYLFVWSGQRERANKATWGDGSWWGVISKIYGAALHEMHASCN